MQNSTHANSLWMSLLLRRGSFTHSHIAFLENNIEALNGLLINPLLMTRSVFGYPKVTLPDEAKLLTKVGLACKMNMTRLGYVIQLTNLLKKYLKKEC